MSNTADQCRSGQKNSVCRPQSKYDNYGKCWINGFRTWCLVFWREWWLTHLWCFQAQLILGRWCCFSSQGVHWFSCPCREDVFTNAEMRLQHGPGLQITRHKCICWAHAIPTPGLHSPHPRPGNFFSFSGMHIISAILNNLLLCIWSCGFLGKQSVCGQPVICQSSKQAVFLHNFNHTSQSCSGLLAKLL